jgi:hypothetical protein
MGSSSAGVRSLLLRVVSVRWNPTRSEAGRQGRGGYEGTRRNYATGEPTSPSRLAA